MNDDAWLNLLAELAVSTGPGRDPKHGHSFTHSLAASTTIAPHYGWLGEDLVKLLIIVGSVMGTSEGVAHFLARELTDKFQPEVSLNADVNDLTRDPDELLLFCTSNTGCGDLPDNIMPLYLKLLSEPPNIAGRRYALINLGDSTYPTFGEAGMTLNAALEDIGAVPIAEPLVIDASVDRYPQKIALDWLREILG
ncbi:MAG: flavodoxin domain-containing protein [Pseudomonadota bacterium]